MKKMCLIFLVILGFKQLVFGKTVCENDNFRHFVENPNNSIALKDHFSGIASSTQLAIIGDSHGWTSLNLLRDFFKESGKLKLEQKKCLFLEFPSSMRASEIMDNVKMKLEIENISNEEKKGVKRFLNYYGSILKFADQFGFSVFTVDHPKHWKKDQSLNDRDESIFNRLTKLMSSGTCESGILIVGKAHISPDEDNRITLVDYLKGSSVSFTTYNFVDSQDRIPYPSMWGLNRLCRLRASTPFSISTIPFIFETKSVDFFSSLLPLYSDIGPRWDGFDWTVLY